MGKISKEFKYDLEHQSPVFVVPEWLPGERFEMITDQAAPGILPYYAISTFGRIWHVYMNRFMSTSWDGPGYRIAVLRFKDGMAHTCRVHRLMMLTFRYFPGCEDMMVNHINGRKTANWIDYPGIANPDNLEWCDGSYNQKEAIRLGLKHPHTGKIEESSKLTEEQVRSVCECLQEGNLTLKQISEVTGVNLGQVQNIKYKTWRSITCEYNF
jgi:hypothetical protein